MRLSTLCILCTRRVSSERECNAILTSILAATCSRESDSASRSKRLLVAQKGEETSPNHVRIVRVEASGSFRRFFPGEASAEAPKFSFYYT